MPMAPLTPRTPVIVDAVRTPFCRSGGRLAQATPVELGKQALLGLVAKTGVDPLLIERVVLGTVVQDPASTNLARECVLAAGLSQRTPAFTVTLACISSSVAAATVADQILLGRIDLGIAGGAESFSDPPIRLSRPLRQALPKLRKAKGPADLLSIVRHLSPEDLLPDVPAPIEPSTGLTMGEGCERLARRLGVRREESDAYAARSHVLADRAWTEGRYTDEVVPVALPPGFDLVQKDDGPRGDTTPAVLAKLPPAFDAALGIATAGSSSFLSDGAAAVLLAARERAVALGLPQRAFVRDHVCVAGDPLDELLLGPAVAIPLLLAKNGLSARDIGVWELHEAFAAQVIACLKCLADRTFLESRTGTDARIDVPLDALNVWGGSLSLGHPFGATGARLLATASRRLAGSGARFAVVAACAAGGHGSAILLENAQ
jgi:acetyl-CoA acyltransferase